MPPVLEITPEMVGPNRTDMTRAYLIAVMVWPDHQDQRREVMKNGDRPSPEGDARHGTGRKGSG